MIATVILAAGIALVTVLLLPSAPRCPECGSHRSDQSRESPRVRHCRSCLNTYEVKR
jgi:transposase